MYWIELNILDETVTDTTTYIRKLINVDLYSDIVAKDDNNVKLTQPNASYIIANVSLDVMIMILNAIRTTFDSSLRTTPISAEL